jgi:hypothetical protein
MHSAAESTVSGEGVRGTVTCSNHEMYSTGGKVGGAPVASMAVDERPNKQLALRPISFVTRRCCRDLP